MGDVLFEIFKCTPPPPILLRKITFQFVYGGVRVAQPNFIYLL